jgi:hypothetical protein
VASPGPPVEPVYDGGRRPEPQSSWNVVPRREPPLFTASDRRNSRWSALAIQLDADRRANAELYLRLCLRASEHGREPTSPLEHSTAQWPTPNSGASTAPHVFIWAVPHVSVVYARKEIRHLCAIVCCPRGELSCRTGVRRTFDLT